MLSSGYVHAPDSLSASPTSDLGSDELLLKAIIQLALRLRLRGVDLESSTGLCGRELDLIVLLGLSGPTSVKNLVAELGLARSTMTAIVDRLEARDLVKRLPNPQDRRSVILEATPNASEALILYRQWMQALIQHLRAVLGRDEHEQFAHLIRKIDGSF